MEEMSAVPIVMSFAGNDPTGGAGIVADIETLASMGCHCAPVITALTVQDSVNMVRFDAVEMDLLIEQARAVLEDMPVSCFKIGMLGSEDAVVAIHSILMDYPGIPVVLDPILRAGGGTQMADDELIEAMIELLFPLTTVLTPNSLEARRLAHEADTLDACAHELLDMGCEYVLLTGAHETTPEVVNRLYGNSRLMEKFSWGRLAESYHGSGCTLASAIAGMLAHGVEPFTAIHDAQDFAWQSLKNGHRLGMGQHMPNRFFWARGEDDEPTATE
ncbi:MAG: hydroxymethylpyrimidine/phosphomethylpyrimidine kinase [Gammaproteobacteria bacterium]|nr:hydroxymethylpyrimidine/phosphomethylpyrimidine kinase [Gammaproteobacteria bacterium]MCF6230590.1 hydroxymethylpyrimidine/phosphomethylpyrimidine kinase [Gammaproteobacteria bacterium]